jgi:carboxylate-amine ligase
MLEQVEIASDPTVDLAVLGADLRARRKELIESASQRGVTVAALGTSPVATEPHVTPDERYQRMRKAFGLIAAEHLTCGTHVHVAVSSRAEGVATIDGVRRWLSVLLALSANSPFWMGRDTGYASYRSIAMGRWPTAGPTAAFGDEDGYDRAVSRLIASGAALDVGMIYFDVRLSAKYPTVEFRVADVGQEVSDSVLLAALCRAAVDTVTSASRRESDLSVPDLRAAAWRAARYGLSGELVDVAEQRLRPAAVLLDQMVHEFTPALDRAGDLELVNDSLEHVLRRGTGADLQRADLNRGSSRDLIAAAAARAAS